MTREYTNKLYEMLEDGLIDKDVLINAFCSYMSEDDIKDLMECNEFIQEEDDDDEENENEN